MKNFIKILSAVLLVTAINACTLQEATDSTPTGAISVTAQTVQKQAATNVPETKTTYSSTAEGLETHWVANTDQIGIFSPQAKPTVEDPAPTNNAAFTAQTSAKSSGFTGTMFWGTGEHHFYAYYPYDSEYSGDQTAVPISLPSAQSQSAAGNTAHIGALDYMVATPLTVTPPGAVNFSFKHVFAMIEFQIKGSGTLTQINLIGADPLACEGTIDLTQTPGANAYTITKSSTSKYVTVTLGSAATLSTETAISVYMMVLPGAQSENMEVALKIDDNWKILDKTPPTGGLARGMRYVVSLDTGSAGWYSTMTDSRDSNVYDLVVIGGQVWMKENLAYLPSVVGLATSSTTKPYCYVHGYDGTDVSAAKATSNYITYGVLYNWPAAMNGAGSSTANPSGVQGICPTGWHLPSDAEWTQLTDYVGGTSVAGGKLKSTDTGNGIGQWKSPNTDATDEYGFTALPGGYYNYLGLFRDIGNSSNWWSSTSTGFSVWSQTLSYINSTVAKYNNPYEEAGFSVRCLRD
ncbi:MAG: FISUMP domain-containing protein [Bacteroidales bacterium]|nr:FISUMP domain-containing protein [Bacteroidales bacterium]